MAAAGALEKKIDRQGVDGGVEAAQMDVALLAETVNKLPNERVTVPAAVLAVMVGLLAGYLMGKAW